MNIQTLSEEALNKMTGPELVARGSSKAEG
jgi:hypothetical protein